MLGENITAVIGAQWGDEGKGKIVDYLGKFNKIAVRFNGGHNAGHSTEDDHGNRLAFHLLPACAHHDGMTSVLARGMVLHLPTLHSEIRHAGGPVYVDERAHLVLPHHMVLDGMQEDSRDTEARIGTTRRGIGPAYSDRVARIGLPVGEAIKMTRSEIADYVLEGFRRISYSPLPIPSIDLLPEIDSWNLGAMKDVVDTTDFLRGALKTGLKVLLAGAHGTMLDIDHGPYPFVTSSACSSAGVGAGTGISPRLIGHVLGVCKVYSTRIGNGPFPSEMDKATGDRLREYGREYGTTTGRPRRMGWLDMEALKYSHLINDFSALALTRLDILDQEKDILVYLGQGDWQRFNGWQTPTRGITHWRELPDNAKAFINWILYTLRVDVEMVSTGPERSSIILL